MKKSLFILGIAISLCITFISCKNFMNGDGLKEEIEEKIRIENSVKPKILESYPKDTENGTYKNSVIRINFDKQINENSFIFSDKELEELAENTILLKNKENKVYAYITDGYTYFKNIKIESNEGKSICEYFTCPSLSDDKKTLEIIPDEFNQIDVNDKLKIRVFLSEKISDIENIPVCEEYHFTYTVNNSIDKEKPEFRDIVAKHFQDNEISFIAGEVTDSNFKTVLSTNHIRQNLNLYVEGNDYGGGSVFAKITTQKINDKNGSPVTAEKFQYINELTDKTAANSSSSIQIDFINDSETDGLYKVTVTLLDAGNNESDESYIYYIIKDTNLIVPFDTCLSTPGISHRIERKEEESWTPNTFEALNYRNEYFYISNLEDDLYYTYKKSDGTYGELRDSFLDYTFEICFGKSFAETEKRLNILKCTTAIIQEANNRYHIDIIPPHGFRDYQNNNLDDDIYTEIILYDRVGNSYAYKTLVPKRVNILALSYDDNEKSLTINPANSEVLFNNNQEKIKVANYTKELRYRVYYAKQIPGKSIKELEVIRNFVYDYYTDPYDQYSDSFIIPDIDSASKYVVCIQAINSFSYNGSEWLGTVYGPLTYVTDITPGNFEDSSIIIPEFTVDKKVLAKNTGTTEITINYSEGDPETKYYPAWSTDGTTWNYFETTKFIVPTYLEAPVNDEDLYHFTGKDLYNELDYFIKSDHVSVEHELPPFESKAYVKLIGVRNGKRYESVSKTVVFNSETDDNIPPVINSFKSAHNIVLSNDGHSMDSVWSFVNDECLSLNKGITYYYTPYNESWKYNLSVMSDEEIQKLPHDYAELRFWDSVDKDDYSHEYSDSELKNHLIFYRTSRPFIQTDNLENGSYMIFVKIHDCHGNSTIGTLGQIDINSYQNNAELNLEYDSTEKTIKYNISLEKGNNILEQNEFRLQYVKLDENYSKWYPWETCVEDLYENNTSVLKHSGSISILNNIDDAKKLNTFYRVISLGYDVDEKTVMYKVREQNESVGLWKDTWIRDSENLERYNNYNPYGKYISSTDSLADDWYLYYDAWKNETVDNQTVKYLSEEPVSYDMKYFESTKQGVFLEVDKPTMITLIKSKTDYGDDIKKWITKGNHNITLIADETNTYKKMISAESVFKDEIKNYSQGTYYVYVIHYSDNSEPDISRVYKK